MISYSRSRGIFAGLELKGAVISADREANEAVYQLPVSARDIIIEGKVRTPEIISVFQRTLGRFSPRGMIN